MEFQNININEILNYFFIKFQNNYCFYQILNRFILIKFQNIFLIIFQINFFNQISNQFFECNFKSLIFHIISKFNN